MSDNLYLFANNNGGQAENNGSYRLYDMKIKGDSEGVESGINYVDYLESDGSSWIDTGIHIITGFRVEVEVEKLKNTGNSLVPICGVGTPIQYSYGRENGDFGLGLLFSKLTIKDENDKYNITDIEIPLNIITTIKYTAKNVISKHSLPLFTHGVTLDNFYTDYNLSDYARIYSFKIYNTNNTLLLHLRPCLDVEGIPCMYDEVSKQYFYNQGTGTFGYKKTLRDFQPVLDSNNIPCLLDKINRKYYYNKSGDAFSIREKPKYKKIPYLSGNGTGYINTGIAPTTGYKYSFLFTKYDYRSIGCAVCGVGSGDMNASTNHNSGGTGYHWNYGWHVPNRNTATYNNLSDTLCEVTITNDSQSIRLPMYIFAWNGNANGARDFIDEHCKLYYFKIWDSSENLVFDAIPVLDQDNIPCMYDKVTDAFFYNQGTGTFGYEVEELDGNSDSYTEIEYIESTGTQYIDTEVVPTANTDIDMTCRSCDYSESPTVNNSYILNGLVINNNKYNYKGTDTTVQPNLVASEGATLTMGSANLAYLTDDEKEQAINNGWSLL